MGEARRRAPHKRAMIMFKPGQVGDSDPPSQIADFWRHALRPAIRRGDGKCSLCARALDRSDDDPAQVILCAASSEVVAVTVCRRCGDDDWNCFRPDALEAALKSIAGDGQGGHVTDLPRTN